MLSPAEERHDRATAELLQRFTEAEQQVASWPDKPTEAWQLELLKSRSWL